MHVSVSNSWQNFIELSQNKVIAWVMAAIDIEWYDMSCHSITQEERRQWKNLQLGWHTHVVPRKLQVESIVSSSKGGGGTTWREGGVCKSTTNSLKSDLRSVYPL